MAKVQRGMWERFHQVVFIWKNKAKTWANFKPEIECEPLLWAFQMLTSTGEILYCCGFSSVFLQEMPNGNALWFKTWHREDARAKLITGLFTTSLLPALINFNEEVSLLGLLKSAFCYDGGGEVSATVALLGCTQQCCGSVPPLQCTPVCSCHMQGALKTAIALQIPPTGVFSWPYSTSLWPFPSLLMYPWRIVKCRDQVVVQVHWNAQEGFLLITSNPLFSCMEKKILNIISNLTI